MPLADRDRIPSEVELGEVSPYRPRQKVMQSRRSRLSWLVKLVRWTVWVVLVVPLVGYGGYRLAFLAQNSPEFMLTSEGDVVVEGNQHVTPEEVLNALGVPKVGVPGLGVSLFRLSLEDKRRAVEAIPWVQSATLERLFPHRLKVKIIERKPVGYVNAGGALQMVDADGVLLGEPEKGQFDFPVLSGVDANLSSADRKLRVALYLEFMHQLADLLPGSGWSVSEVHLDDPGDLTALVVEGHDTILLHFGDSNFRERFQSFLTLLPEVRKTQVKIDSIDLRYRGQVVVNPQSVEPQGAASPPGAGDAGVRKE